MSDNRPTPNRRTIRSASDVLLMQIVNELILAKNVKDLMLSK